MVETALEESLIQLIASEPLWELHPMVETACPSVELEAHFLKSFPISLTLEAVVCLNGCTLLLHTAWFEELHAVELTWVRDTSHAERREVLKRLDIFFTRNHPANANSWALQSFGRGAGQKDVAVVDILHILDATHLRVMEHLICLIQKATVLCLLGHLDEFFQLITIPGLSGGVLGV